MTQEFAFWCETASVPERSEAASYLCDALFDVAATGPERQRCTEALLHLVADASPKVRQTLARRFAREAGAPRALVRVLCDDGDAVAVPLVTASRALLEEDLIDLSATGSTRLRCAIARRPSVTVALSAALVMAGERVVALELLANQSAAIAPTTLRQIAEGPDGADGDVRDLLLRRESLPADIRQTLVLRAGEQLATMGLARHVLGDGAARRIATEACEQATGTIADGLAAARMADFVQHLRQTGQVTTAFLVRSACEGWIDLFATTLASLSGLQLRRVRAIIVEAHQPSFFALCAASGIGRDVAPLLLTAIRIWRDVSRGDMAPSGEAGVFVAERMAALIRDGELPVADELRGLVVRLSAQAVRRSARRIDPGRLAA